MIDPLVQLTLTVSLSLVFFMAGRHKLADLPRFRAQMLAYDLLPAQLVKPLALLLPWLELVCSATLLVPWTNAMAAVLGMALLMLYAGVMSANLLRGRVNIDCGCGGKPQPLSWWLVVRNLLLSAAALLLLAPDSGRAYQWLDLPLLVLMTTLLALTYTAAGQLVSNHSAMSKRKHTHG